MWSWLLLCLTAQGWRWASAQSEASENGLAEDPIVTCGDSYIGISFKTREVFEGNLFVKDEFADPECRVSGNGTVRGTELRLGFETCGVERRRSVEPRGVFVSTMLVLSFHEQFITKKDKAYMIQCYYMESMKMVMTEITVAMLTTSFQTQVVPMPVCRYEVLAGGPSGPPVRYAQIGDKVYHKWTCDSETVDTFCILVHSCTVNDGGQDLVQLLDNDGCALDEHLLANLDYVSDLMAGKEAHVFKYADRHRLFFDCQIAISVKEPGFECPRPANCDLPRRRGKRDAAPLTLRHHDGAQSDGICMDSFGTSAYAAANAVLLLLSVLFMMGALREARLTSALDKAAAASAATHFPLLHIAAPLPQGPPANLPYF